MPKIKIRYFTNALLSLRSNPPASLLITFLLGLVLIAVLGSVLFMWIATPAQVTGDVLVRAGASALVIFAIAVATFSIYVDGLNMNSYLIDNQQIAQFPYVITAISPLDERVASDKDKVLQNLGLLINQIEHNGSTLKHMYLIGTFASSDPSAQGVDRAYQALADHLRHIRNIADPDSLLKQVSVDSADTAEHTFKMVQALLIQNSDLKSDNTLIDITAGRKPMSVGLMLAGMLHKCTVCYQATERDDNGRPLPSGKTVLYKLDTDLKVIAPFLRSDVTQPPIS